uniref:zinc finger protein 346 isoform X3 n=1 Tax=Jaculus jaculus TaxID=51337 RepID=UPI001E1B4EEA|nr:zinc finger protein 346 isoform X3 [Jaculus jaculus]
MECPVLDSTEAAGGGGAGPGDSSEEREGREPDRVCFDRERARRLWEAVSGAQPVGRKEVEHMIQKNQCLFTNTQCKVCCALLISESQKLAHYQKSSRSKDKNQCCPICNMTFSSPVVAQSHYLGKTHAKNLKLKQQSTKVEALHQNREVIDPDKFCSLCHATFNDPAMAQQHYMGKKHRKQETKLKLMAHYGRLADPAVTDLPGHQKLARCQYKGRPSQRTQARWKISHEPASGDSSALGSLFFPTQYIRRMCGPDARLGCRQSRKIHSWFYLLVWAL